MCLYFDISDIVYFARRYNRVTGIQRVQLNIISVLAAKHGLQYVRCIFFDGANESVFEVDMSQRVADAEFDADGFLAMLGLGGVGGRFPSKVQVKSFLRRYQHNKLLRTLRKAEIHLAKFFWPAHLQTIGVMSRQHHGSVEKLPITPLVALPPEGRYVSLGSAWLCPDMVDFAEKHAMAGGIVVQMVYDLIPVLHSQYLQESDASVFATWLSRVLKFADSFVAISDWTADDLRSFAGKHGCSPKVKTIRLAHEYLGYPRFEVRYQPPEFERLVGRRFVLCVGTIEPRKNGVLLAKAWKRLYEELGEQLPILVFAGKLGRGMGEFEQVIASSRAFAEFVHIVHTPSDECLAWLYSNSLFTTYPSLSEGWGLPVGEAAWFGKYCVASAASSVPEVCGPLADYVDPTQLDSLVCGLRHALCSPQYLQEREAALIAADMRLWSDVAEEVFCFCQSRSKLNAAL